MSPELGTALIAAVAGGVVGGVAGLAVARMQRTWDLDARRREDRRARIRAGVDVILKFLDEVDRYRRLDGTWPMAKPLEALTNADRWAVASVLRLYPDGSTFERFFYPPNFVRGDGVVEGAIPKEDWDALHAHVGKRLAVLTAELEKLGDKDLRNFQDT